MSMREWVPVLWRESLGPIKTRAMGIGIGMHLHRTRAEDVGACADPKEEGSYYCMVRIRTSISTRPHRRQIQIEEETLQLQPCP